MKVVVLGAGLMGKEVVRDLMRHDHHVTKVFLADVNVKQAKAFAEQLNDPRLEVLFLDATDTIQLREVMSFGNIVINALYYAFNEKVARMAVYIGVHLVDLGGHIGGVTDRVLALSQEAEEKGITIIPDLGVAPGMINILTGYGAKKLDQVEAIRLYVGGIPIEPSPPLYYRIVFSLDGVFDHYTDPSIIIRNGELMQVPSLSEIESLSVAPYGELEAFHTSGGTSTLIQTFRDVKTLEYKTIRHKGHAQRWKLLVDLGLLSKGNEVSINGQTIQVRDVMRAQLTPLLRLADQRDVVILRVIVSGKCEGQPTTITYQMVTEKDTEVNETAMARATANTISVVAQMIGSGVIQKRGVWPPELIVPGSHYIEEMSKRGVMIEELQS